MSVNWGVFKLNNYTPSSQNSSYVESPMSEELEQAIGGIAGIIFGGLLLLLLAPELNQVSAVDLNFFGILFMFAGVILAAALVYSAIKSILP